MGYSKQHPAQKGYAIYARFNRFTLSLRKFFNFLFWQDWKKSIEAPHW